MHFKFTDWTSEELLIQAGAPLHNACINDFPEIVKILLENGANSPNLEVQLFMV